MIRIFVFISNIDSFFHFSLDFRIEIYINGGMDNIPLKYCLYARKSSESDEKQALSIDSQIVESSWKRVRYWGNFERN